VAMVRKDVDAEELDEELDAVALEDVPTTPEIEITVPPTGALSTVWSRVSCAWATWTSALATCALDAAMEPEPAGCWSTATDAFCELSAASAELTCPCADWIDCESRRSVLARVVLAWLRAFFRFARVASVAAS